MRERTHVVRTCRAGGARVRCCACALGGRSVTRLTRAGAVSGWSSIRAASSIRVQARCSCCTGRQACGCGCSPSAPTSIAIRYPIPSRSARGGTTGTFVDRLSSSIHQIPTKLLPANPHQRTHPQVHRPTTNRTTTVRRSPHPARPHATLSAHPFSKHTKSAREIAVGEAFRWYILCTHRPNERSFQA